jgi:predicted  nucleic acid-binding Zn-ribbon protein
LDLSQATKLLTWLDEEHRKDKALLMELQSHIDAQREKTTEQSRQFQDIQAALTRIEGQLPKMAQLETAIQSVRTEFAGLLAKSAAEQETRQEQRVRAGKQESETVARLIRQLQERVEGLGSFDASVELLRDQDSRLQAELTKVYAQLSEIAKRSNTQDQRVDQLARDGHMLRDGLASAKLSYEDLVNQSVTLKVAFDALGPRLDAKIEQLNAALQDVGKGRQMDLQPLQMKQQEQARLLEELGKEIRSLQLPIERWSKQMEEFSTQFEHNRKTLYDLHEVERQVRQQGNELAELQRLAAERQRVELREWQDTQSKVDEEHTARVERVEAWQQKSRETLEKLEASILDVEEEAAKYTDEFWHVWSEFVQGQTQAYADLKQRRTR